MLKIKDDSKSEENSRKLIEGTTEIIPANGKVEISFTATVEKVNGKLINIATIGENEVEKDIILKHMWPLTFKLPTYSESYIVTTADKYCATREFFLYFKYKRRAYKGCN